MSDKQKKMEIISGAALYDMKFQDGKWHTMSLRLLREEREMLGKVARRMRRPLASTLRELIRAEAQRAGDK